MRTLRIWLRLLFLRGRSSPAHHRTKEVAQDPATFEAWISGYRQRLLNHCERNQARDGAGKGSDNAAEESAAEIS